MDIPAPSENPTTSAAKDVAKVAEPIADVAASPTAVKPAVVAVETSAKAPDTPPTQQDDQDKLKADVEKDNEQRKKILELITSKKFNLGIKEKRSTPILTVSLMPKKSKKSKHKSSSTGKTEAQKSSKKIESKNAKLIKLAVILALWVGFYLAIDAGLIDIGWKPPISLIGKEESPETLNFTGDTPKK